MGRQDSVRTIFERGAKVKPKFSMGAILLITTLIGLMFSFGPGRFGAMVVGTPLPAIIAVEILAAIFAVRFLGALPNELRRASAENCRRMDGSVSQRRHARELRARRKVYSDLSAVCLLVAMASNGAAYFVHSQLIPLPLAWDAMTAFNSDPAEWRSNIEKRGLVAKHRKAIRSSAGRESAALDRMQSGLWNGWGGILILALVWVGGCYVCVRLAYMRILRDFYAGLRERSREYLSLDTSRMQSHFDLLPSQVL
jgi:hypothetical protein